MRIVAQEKVILCVLPPHTTQPLEGYLFFSQTNWKRVCHEFITENLGTITTRYDFSALFHEAWDRSMIKKNIKSGFQITGVYPLNKDVVTLPKLLSEQTGLEPY